MKAKTKAKKLVDKYINASFNCKGCDMPYCDIKCTMLNKMEAKECAFLAVDEAMESLRFLPYGLDYLQQIEYWEDVKNEINKL